MAGVVIDAQALGQALIARTIGFHLAIKLNHFGARLEVAQRLRLDSQMQVFAGSLAQLIDVVDHLPKVATHRCHLLAARDEFLVRTGHRTDTPTGISWRNCRQDIEQSFCVLNALGSGPVRRVDVLLHASTVKIPVREAIHSKDIAAVFL